MWDAQRMDRSPPPRAWTGSRTMTATQIAMDRINLVADRHSAAAAMTSASSIRASASRASSATLGVSASGFRAFRAPTPSELYRSTQVGNQLTLANGSLLSERATGWEAGIAAERSWGSIRSSYFLTEVNRPIAAVTIYATSFAHPAHAREPWPDREPRRLSRLRPSPRSLARRRRRLPVRARRRLARHAGLGNWIPEVARNLATLNLRASRPRLGTLSLQSRLSGRSSTTTPTPICSTATSASTPTPRTTSASALELSSPPAKISSTAPSRFRKRRPPRSASPAPPASASASASALPPANAHFWFKNFLLSNGSLEITKMYLYRKALRLYPRSAQILNNLGTNLLMQLNTGKRRCRLECFWIDTKSPRR